MIQFILGVFVGAMIVFDVCAFLAAVRDTEDDADDEW